MEAIYLQSMTDQIESIENYVHESHNKERGFDLIKNYKDFLKQPSQLGFFVPCDSKNNILPEPKMRPEWNSFDEEDMDYDAQELYEYIEANKRVLFKGFEFKEYERVICFDKKGIEIFIYNKNYQTFYAPRGKISTIEDLIIYEFELSENAIKQIGL